MKYLHFFIALLCTTLFSPLNTALAQDGEKEGDAAEGGDAGGAAPAEGGGDTAAGGGDATPAAAPAPAAGGEGGGDAAAAPAPAPAPAPGGEAAAPAPAAPAPAPAAPAIAAPAAPAPAPAFDMGAAMTSTVAAPPPAAVATESNAVANAVKVSAASGGALSLSDAVKIGAASIRKIANDKTGGAASFENLARNIDAKTKVIKAFGGIDDLSKLDDIIEETEDFSADDLESFQTLSLDEAKSVSKDSSGAMISLTNLKDTVAVKAKVAKAAKDNGLTVASQLATINALTAAELNDMRETKLDDLVVAVKAVGADALSDVSNLKSVAETVATSGAEAVLAELNNVILKDAKGLPLVVESGGKYVWSKDLTKGRVFHGVYKELDDGDGELGVFRISIAAGGKTNGLDIMGADYGDNWSETFELTSDPSVAKSTEYDDEGNAEEVFYIKVLKASDGSLVLGSIQFEDDNDLSADEIADGAIPFSQINSAEAKARIALLSSSNTVEDFKKNDFLSDSTLFATEADALKEYNKIFDANAKVELDDENGKAIVVSLGEGNEKEYYWARELNGVKMRTVNGSRSVRPDQETLTASSASTWTSGSDTGSYFNKGKILVDTLVENGVTETTYNRIIKDSNGFRIINITRTDGKNPWDADEELWDKFLWWDDSYWANTVVPGVDGSGNWQNSDEIEYIAGTASEATALYNMLLDLWHNDDPNRKDTDGDGIPDYKDIDQNPGKQDTDGDGIVDEYDNDKAHKLTLDQVLKDLFPADNGAAFLAKLEEMNDGSEASRNAVAAATELLVKILTNRNLNGPLDNMDWLRMNDLESLNIPESFINLVADANLIGTSNNKDIVRNFLEVFTNNQSFDFEQDMTLQNWAPLLEDLLTANDASGEDSSNRARLSNNSASRADDLSNRGLTYNLDQPDQGKAIDLKVLSGSNVNIATGVSFNAQATDRTDVTIISAAKDVTLGISGSSVDQVVTIDTPDWEPGRPQGDEDVYVIAAADDLQFRSAWKAETHEDDYNNPERLEVTIDHSSLALAATDTMYMINVDITTGGGLAIATMDDIYIDSQDGTKSEFDIGTNGNDFESLYLYAHNDINIRNLMVKGHVDDVYMEAKTINLYDVSFPKSAAVLLRSEDGAITFTGNPVAGAVNFRNVIHNGLGVGHVVGSGDFTSSKVGNHKTALNSSGRPYIEVQSFRTPN